MRDGFAVQSTVNLPGRLRVTGEFRVGNAATRPVKSGECVEIMTGALVPVGADAVLMVEHAERRRRPDRCVHTAFIDVLVRISVPLASEARPARGSSRPGARIDYAHIGAMATRRGRYRCSLSETTVSIITTGDELVDVEQRRWIIRFATRTRIRSPSQMPRAGGRDQYFRRCARYNGR